MAVVGVDVKVRLLVKVRAPIGIPRLPVDYLIGQLQGESFNNMQCHLYVLK